MRLFTALELSGPAHDELARVQEALKARIRYKRWQPLHQAHVTLHFLGDVAEERLEAVQAACAAAAAGHGPFTLSLGPLGAFPNTRKAGVLWVGLGGDLDALHALQADGKARIEAAGVELEDRPYSPHLTLAREPLARVDWEAMTVGLDIAPCPWHVEAFTLFQSQLTPRGAIHTPLGTHQITALSGN